MTLPPPLKKEICKFNSVLNIVKSAKIHTNFHCASGQIIFIINYKNINAIIFKPH